MEQIIIQEDGTKVLQTTVQQPVVTTVSEAELKQQIADATIACDDGLNEVKIAQDYAAGKQSALDTLIAQLSTLQTKLADPKIPVTDLQVAQTPMVDTTSQQTAI